jgi:signal transduction histidine kinase
LCADTDRGGAARAKRASLNPLSIRTRVTVWYFCFFAIAGLLLSLSSWFLLRQSLDTLLLHELDERVDDFETFLATGTSSTDLKGLRVEVLREYQAKDEGKWLQIIDARGSWVYCSNRGAIANSISPLPLSPGKPFPFVARSGHSLRSFTRTVSVHGQTYYLATAISADNSVKILARFRLDLSLLVPPMVLAAAVAGHFLSRKALNPVAAIVAEARCINDRNLAARLPVFRARDELSELTETLNQMLDRIEIAFRSVRSLTANTSHELRTPLTLIRTRIEIALCFTRTSEQYREVLEEVRKETLSMTSLIENLLALARLDAGAYQPELRPVNIIALVNEAAKEWTPTAESLGLDLAWEEPDAPIWILGHAESLARLLRMLIDNACRFNQSGGWIRLTVGTEDTRVTIAVEDSGVGISDQDMPHIFDRFYRAQSPQRESSGSGLGLSLAKWIADQHNTSILAESTLGVGSRFQVAFARNTEN